MKKVLKAKYRRILLKLSGEALGGEHGVGISPEAVHEMARQIAEVREMGVQVVVVAPQDSDDRGAVGFLTATLGREPVWQDGVWVWYGLGSDPPIGMGPLRLYVCATLPATTPLETPSCVLRP